MQSMFVRSRRGAFVRVRVFVTVIALWRGGVDRNMFRSVYAKVIEHTAGKLCRLFI